MDLADPSTAPIISPVQKSGSEPNMAAVSVKNRLKIYSNGADAKENGLKIKSNKFRQVLIMQISLTCFFGANLSIIFRAIKMIRHRRKIVRWLRFRSVLFDEFPVSEILDVFSFCLS